MGLFSRTDGTKKETIESEQESATRAVSGFPDLKSVKDAISSGVSPVETPRRGRQSAARSATGVPQVTGADIEKALAAAEKEKKKQEAIDLAMGTIAKQLAETPYEVWAFYAEQPAFALKPDESKKLADAYHMLAKALAPDLTGPGAMLGIVVMLNVSLIGQRLAEDRKRKQDEEKERLEKEKGNRADSIVN